EPELGVPFEPAVVHERTDEHQRGRATGYPDPEADTPDRARAERGCGHDEQDRGCKRTEVEEEALVWCRGGHCLVSSAARLTGYSRRRTRATIVARARAAAAPRRETARRALPAGVSTRADPDLLSARWRHRAPLR